MTHEDVSPRINHCSRKIDQKLSRYKTVASTFMRMDGYDRIICQSIGIRDYRGDFMKIFIIWLCSDGRGVANDKLIAEKLKVISRIWHRQI